MRVSVMRVGTLGKHVPCALALVITCFSMKYSRIWRSHLFSGMTKSTRCASGSARGSYVVRHRMASENLLGISAAVGMCLVSCEKCFCTLANAAATDPSVPSNFSTLLMASLNMSNQKYE